MWVPLHQHSSFGSLLDGLPTPEQIAGRLKECGYTAGAITEHGSLASVPSVIREFKKAGIKAIAGEEFYVSQQDTSIKDGSNRSLTHLCVLAKNKDGWRNLIKASAFSYDPANFYYKPRLKLEQIASYSHGSFIAFSGHPGSDLANACFKEPKIAYSMPYEKAKSMLKDNVDEVICREIGRFQELFGKDNFYVEIQLVDAVNLPAARIVAEILRRCAKKMGCKCIATADSHYCRKQDAEDQRVLLCVALGTTRKLYDQKLEDGDDISLAGFFRSDNYHIPTLEEIIELHKDYPDELKHTLEIAEQCEKYSLDSKPIFPQYECPDNLSSFDYMKKLCQDGWDKLKNKFARDENVYLDRLNMELGVIKEAGLSDYFLVVQDYVRYARYELKCLVGKGRGSAAGCLISYLLEITKVDPIKYDLMFERFYNAGRNTADRIAMPDIDVDFPVAKREKIIQYIQRKYGPDRVAHMATYNRMQGRSAVKDVLRVWNRVDFDTMNEITSHIPDESKIAGELQEMEEESGESSIIRWALENRADKLRDWCYIEDGRLEGPLAKDFAQAIRLEGTKRSMGKHPSGIIIAAYPLTDICPMVYDKGSGQWMTSVDMVECEYLGLIKADVLGTNVLDKLETSQSLIRTGRL